MFQGQFDTYSVQSLVARGRSGEIFRATGSDGQPVAVKRYGLSETGRGEAARLAQVRHDGIVALLDHGETDSGQLWIALPWIDGSTLGAFMADQAPVDLDRAQYVVEQLADAVDTLHAASIVHGDLSPNNILIDDHDRITVIDLSASTVADSEAVGETVGIDVNVTPRYASPEVARGDPAGPASDRYALGLITYELLTGSFPFPDVATPIAMLAHHDGTEPLAPSEHRPHLPVGVDQAILAALAKDADRRPVSATGFAAALAADRSPRRRSRTSLLAGSKRWTAGIGLLVFGTVAALSGVAWRGGGDDSDPARWRANEAAGLSCNIVKVPGFEAAELPDDFYGGDPTNTASLVSGEGIDQSLALRVGGEDRFGLFGEVVPVIPGRGYVFSGSVRHEGDVGTAAMYVDYLNEDFQQLTAFRDFITDGETVGSSEGRRVTIQSNSPADAAYAVPTFFKNGSAGWLLVDEVVFGLRDACPDLTS